MLKRFFIEGEEVSQKDFMRIAEGEHRRSIQELIEDSDETFINSVHFSVESYKVSPEEVGLVEGLQSCLCLPVYIKRTLDDDLYLVILQDSMSNVYLPLEPEYFGFLEQGETMRINEINELLKWAENSD
jgi:hypothetical protein